MTLAAVAKRATTQSTTSSTIRVVETEEKSNIECQKVLASRSDWHKNIADMDTCGAIQILKIVMDGLSRLWTGTRNVVEPRVNVLDICLNHRW